MQVVTKISAILDKEILKGSFNAIELKGLRLLFSLELLDYSL